MFCVYIPDGWTRALDSSRPVTDLKFIDVLSVDVPVAIVVPVTVVVVGVAVVVVEVAVGVIIIVSALHSHLEIRDLVQCPNIVLIIQNQHISPLFTI